jgi:hypothetical protein
MLLNPHDGMYPGGERLGSVIVGARISVRGSEKELSFFSGSWLHSGLSNPENAPGRETVAF